MASLDARHHMHFNAVISVSVPSFLCETIVTLLWGVELLAPVSTGGQQEQLWPATIGEQSFPWKSLHVGALGKTPDVASNVVPASEKQRAVIDFV